RLTLRCSRQRGPQVPPSNKICESNGLRGEVSCLQDLRVAGSLPGRGTTSSPRSARRAGRERKLMVRQVLRRSAVAVIWFGGSWPRLALGRRRRVDLNSAVVSPPAQQVGGRCSRV